MPVIALFLHLVLCSNKFWFLERQTFCICFSESLDFLEVQLYILYVFLLLENASNFLLLTFVVLLGLLSLMVAK